jgi:hypothetical protein
MNHTNSSSTAPVKPLELTWSERWVLIQALGLFVFFVGIVACGFFAVRDTWLTKHTPFPYIGSDRREDTKLRSDAYAYTAAFLQEHKTDVLGTEIWYSDPPFWKDPCSGNGFGVRAVTSVIDPATGASSDITMYFCYKYAGNVNPANQQAQFYTRTVDTNLK